MAWLPCDESVQGKAGRGRFAEAVVVTECEHASSRRRVRDQSALRVGMESSDSYQGRQIARKSSCGLAERGSSSHSLPCSREACLTNACRRSTRLQSSFASISHGFWLKSASITSHVARIPHCSLHRGMHPGPHAGASQPQTVSHTPSCEQQPTLTEIRAHRCI